MEFTDVIKARYSCKKFTDTPLPQEALDAILEAGRLAPTAQNRQEQHIYVLQSPQALAAFDSASPCRYNASTVLVVAYDTANVYTYPGGTHSSGIEDAAIVATHMILAAANAGVDSCWINALDPEKLHAALDLPQGEDILMALDLGYSDGFSPLPKHTDRKPLTETVTYR